jgi:hypothetical protein
MRADVCEPLLDLIELGWRELTESLVRDRAALAPGGVWNGCWRRVQNRAWLFDRHACEWLNEGTRWRAAWSTAAAGVEKAIRTGARSNPQARHRDEQSGTRQQTHLDHVATAQAGCDDLAPVLRGLLLLLLRPSINFRDIRHGILLLIVLFVAKSVLATKSTKVARVLQTAEVVAECGKDRGAVASFDVANESVGLDEAVARSRREGLAVSIIASASAKLRSTQTFFRSNPGMLRRKGAPPVATSSASYSIVSPSAKVMVFVCASTRVTSLLSKSWISCSLKNSSGRSGIHSGSAWPCK